jgi:hypothetical protein
MPEDRPCTANRNNGDPICEVHGRLVDRATAEAKLGKLNQPMLGNYFCPVKGTMFSFSTAGLDVTRESGRKLPD